jgi:hypothetical protein
MKKLYKTRLEKLATHLESGKLGHKKFDFSVVNSNREKDATLYPNYTCGTNGCAIGECPIVFKRQWQFGRWGDVNLIRASTNDCFLDAEKFFGITEEESTGLFLPEEVIPWRASPHSRLGLSATRKAVAKNIRDFIAWKEAQ